MRETEALGTKSKFWFQSDKDPVPWLFKLPRQNTGEHWAEKVTAEIADAMDVFHARVELAQFETARGSASKSFSIGKRELSHGNEILGGQIEGYDQTQKFGQCYHTLENIFFALEHSLVNPEAAMGRQIQFAEYVVLDAIIGNTDRHHENWGIQRRRFGKVWKSRLAPSFDHASSLGRELTDSGGMRSRESILENRRIPSYSRTARGGVYWQSDSQRGENPIQLLRLGAARWPQFFSQGLTKAKQLNRELIKAIMDRIPVDWMTDLERSFALELVCYNLGEVLNAHFPPS